jgi:ATP-binding cassette, subfamily B, bacterial PglK
MLFKNLNFILSKDIKNQAIIVLLFIFVSTLLEVLGISLIIPLISLLFEENGKSSNVEYLNLFVVDNLDQKKSLLFLSIGCLLSYFLKNIFLTYASIKESKFIWKTKNFLSEKIINKYLNNVSFNNKDENTSKILNILIKEVSYLVHLLMNLVSLISETLILISVSIFMLILEPKIFLPIFVLSFLFLSCFHFFTKKKIFKLSEKRLTSDLLYLKKSSQIIEGFREIIIYDKKRYFFQDYKNNNNNIFNINWKLELIQKIPRYWLEYLFIIFIIILLFVLISSNYESTNIPIILGIVVVAAARLLPSAAKAFRAYQQLKIYKPSLDIIIKELQNDNYQILNKNNDFLKNIKLDLKNKISINNIYFAYGKNKIFENLNLEIRKNSMIGIYGPNGCGKSTLLDLIFGFYKPDQGNILIDDYEIGKNINNWQRIISYIPQNIYLLDKTIKENILFDDCNYINQKELDKAISMSSLDDVIINLPDGINTNVGERGGKISGGQIQRIGLARALYKSPQILVMDEATNSIDRESSKKIISTVKNLKDITRIIVSHDLEILKECEKNFYISNHKISELKL